MRFARLIALDSDAKVDLIPGFLRTVQCYIISRMYAPAIEHHPGVEILEWGIIARLQALKA